ncbi:uncharacterized protein HMPREF1541_01770 [Cyphellophora europaea CBS 101466]|uniref:Uncharacterized protein n=1 Tax=Cyphellophora europaea (strain CBS 101466) TaxID=1220924 RepID=W2S3J7_CYPE1|nr:uncharacterized protein HMPREF1541_01770 [Cyphellophora europaea CBS 101466]ETN42613.1 hypothetical protein HMPREF1541_01770 [Cyphellophora europaea CBS 101466]
MRFSRVVPSARIVAQSTVKGSDQQRSRFFASVASQIPATSASRNHKVVIVGGGSAGLAVSSQLIRSGKFAANDIALVDPAESHHYQPGWTLVGGGLKNKEDLRRPLGTLIQPKVRFYNTAVRQFDPEQNSISFNNGDECNYEHLIVCPGINVDFDTIKGLREAVNDPHAPVSSIYSYDTCDKTHRNIKAFKSGQALFTHPTGPVKCAGAPQKIMWLALDGWKRAGLYDPTDTSKSAIQITFATGMPVMFGVPKYSHKLDELRQERGVEALFQHDLVAIEGNTAILAKADGKDLVKKHFDMLHAVPKMQPHTFVRDSPLSNETGFVDVSESTLRHKKFDNVWACGDAAGLSTAKTAAAITAQAPVMVSNLLAALEGRDPQASYDGYTSCPLLTEYGKVMLAEFGYGGKPKETFGNFVDQSTPRREFYHLKKDFFPWVYYNSMVKGTWAGPKGWKW